MAQFKAALFDLDGTLFDTEGQYSVFWGQTGRHYRPDVPNLEYIIKGTTLTQILGTYFPREEWDTIVAGLNEFEANMKFEFLPGALDFIRDLRRHGVKCAIVTSSNEAKMQSVRRQIPEFDDLFDRVLTAEMFAASKPAPDCYLLGAEVLGADVSESIVFEDAFTGLQAGMSAGIFTVGITTCNSRETIEDKCNLVIDSFTELTYESASGLIA